MKGYFMNQYQDFLLIPNAPTTVPYVMIEAIILELFQGEYRKDNMTPMAYHSIRIGRALIEQGKPDYVVFAGYFHDVPEDIENISSLPLDERKEILLQYAEDCDISNPEKAAKLTLECIYLPEEYQAEKDASSKAEGKKIRKEMACKRWANSSADVHAVKMQDIKDNRNDMKSMSEEWQANYDSWAMPLFNHMEKQSKSSMSRDI